MPKKYTLSHLLLLTAVLLILVGVAGYVLFPEVIQRFTHWLIGLMVVVLGLFLRRKK